MGALRLQRIGVAWLDLGWFALGTLPTPDNGEHSGDVGLLGAERDIHLWSKGPLKLEWTFQDLWDVVPPRANEEHPVVLVAAVVRQEIVKLQIRRNADPGHHPASILPKFIKLYVEDVRETHSLALDNQAPSGKEPPEDSPFGCG